MTESRAHPASGRGSSYRVLARKYRPTAFDALIGQDALVRTLTNAFRSGRLAHSYMLTGVRGVGKTTTARIIARALNCIGPDGQGGPTAEPCGQCEPCRAIIEDRFVDVIEMDAASRTGVEDIRDLIDGVRYRPIAARYKVYIVDEVHMLSRNAFNALLKTLEEPPEHVKFIFATTEVRKVPVTVLSRCQRFDLRRVDQQALDDHFSRIAAKEQVAISPEALQLIARAADGSVRDGLSLLDQAIAHGSESDGGAATIGEEQIRAMLGLADRTVIFDLLEVTMAGDTATALALLADQHRAGADPMAVVNDLLELIHWLTRIKIVPASINAAGVPEAERVRGRSLAEKLSMAELTRAWQMGLKGLGEARTAPSPMMAVEMMIVRLAYASRLPTPVEALELWAASGGSPAAGAPQPAATPQPAAGPGPAGTPTAAMKASPPSPPALRPAAPPMPPPTPPPTLPPTPPSIAETARPAAGARATLAQPQSFEDVVEMAMGQREMMLHGQLVADVRLVSFQPGLIRMRLEAGAPADLPRRLAKFLIERTGTPWAVEVTEGPAAPSLLESRRQADEAKLKDALGDPVVKAVMATFPGATVEDVRSAPMPAPEAIDGEDDQLQE
jgi:DNA polymerase-3 subunit gamma/tau